MKKRIIIANWKSNKTIHQTEEWFQVFSNLDLSFGAEEKEIIICPPFTLLPKTKELIASSQLSIMVGSQDISPFGEGAYTGAVHAGQLKEFVTFVIIGHSERRKNFAETDDMLSQKVQRAVDAGLSVIFCVQGVDTPIPQGVTVVAYEPIFAIGSGNPDTPENAEQVIKTIKEKNGTQYVLYGGSVTGENVGSFTNMPSIDGVLVGGASLDAEKFMEIIKNS